MNRIIAITLMVIISASTAGYNHTAMAQTPSNIIQLNDRQTKLQHTQDSLQKIINQTHEKYKNQNKDRKNNAEEKLNKLEKQLFEIRTKLSKINREISHHEQQLAKQTLSTAALKNQTKPTELHLQKPFITSLKSTELNTLSQLDQKAKQALQALQEIIPLYHKLQRVHAKYNTAKSETEQDSLHTTAQKIIQNIKKIDKNTAAKWEEYYNQMLHIYAIMLDIIPGVDRNLLTQLTSLEREIRQELAAVDTKNICPNITVLPQQINLLRHYEMEIAKAANLPKTIIELQKIKPIKIESNFIEPQLKPKVFALYSDALTKQTYSFATTAQIPTIILPLDEQYYCIEVLSLKNQLKNLTSLRGMGPVQLYKTPQGEYKYTIGGFHTLHQAQEQVQIARKAGFKKPTVLCFNNAVNITIEEAELLESQTHVNTNETHDHENQNRYKITIKTTDPTQGEKIRKIATQNHKNITRTSDGNYTIFTVLEFANTKLAEDFAAKIKQNARLQSVEIQEITL